MMALRTCYACQVFPHFFIAVLLMAPASPSTRSTPRPATQRIHRDPERPDRDKEQKPERGHQDAEPHRLHDDRRHSAGSGYFTRSFVWAVQDKGMVYAVDIGAGMLKYTRK